VRAGRLSRALAACVWLCLLFAATTARAEDSAGELYESKRMAAALVRHGRVIEPAPEGKRIVRIEVEREEVFAPDELEVPIVLPRFAPTWPNKFHWLTEEDVVQRELLLDVGERYEQARIDESERNLRALGVFALVRVLAVRGDEPDTVGLLVYTRDLWSLRLETTFIGAGDAFRLSAQLWERNFLGRNKSLAVRTFLDPVTLRVGQLYNDPRVLGGELSLRESLDVIVNRETGQLEGSLGAMTLALPLRDLRQSWSWSASLSYSDLVVRGLRGSDVALYRYVPGEGLELCDEPARGCMRQVWDDRSYTASVSTSYQHGVRYRQSFGLSAVATDREVQANAETALRPDERATFERELLPRARRQVYPSFSYALWLPEFERYHDLGTFGQSEIVRTGPDLGASVSFPLRAFGSSSDSVRFAGSLGYVLGDGRALAELSLGADARLEDGSVVDQSIGGVLRGATPPWFFGRFVAYGAWTAQRRDTSKLSVTLGGDNGLRGHGTGALAAVSGDLLRANIEYRTLPLVLASIHVGGVLFYDAGSVYSELADAPVHQAVGAGLRVLFPQLNRTPFGLDVGVPLEKHLCPPGPPCISVLLSYGTEQTVPLTASDDAAIAASP
jgi:hypothetical protein